MYIFCVIVSFVEYYYNGLLNCLSTQGRVRRTMTKDDNNRVHAERERERKREESLWEIINRSSSKTIGSTIIIINSKEGEKERHCFQSHIIVCFTPKPEEAIKLVITWNELYNILSYLYLQGRGRKKRKLTAQKTCSKRVVIKRKKRTLLITMKY